MAQGHKHISLNATYCGFEFIAVVSRCAALSSATQHAMSPEFGRKLETE